MYICPRSHCGPATQQSTNNHDNEDNWLYKAYESIGSTKTFPIKGYKSFTQMGKNLRLQTCELAKLSPSLNQQFESNAITFEYQCGDTRLLNGVSLHPSFFHNEAYSGKSLN